MRTATLATLLWMLALPSWAAAAGAPPPAPIEAANAVCGGLWLSGGELHDASTGALVWSEASDTVTALACQDGSDAMAAVGATRGARGDGRIVLLRPGTVAGAPWSVQGEISTREVPRWIALESGRLAAVVEGRRDASFGIVDASPGAKLQTVKVAARPVGLGVSPEGSSFVLASGNDLRTFRVEDGRTHAIIPFPEPIVALASQRGVPRVLVGQGSRIVAVDPRDKPDRGALPIRAQADLPAPAKSLAWLEGGRVAGVLIADPPELLMLGGNDLAVLERREQEADAIGAGATSELFWVRGGREKTTGVVRLSAPPPELAPYEPAPPPTPSPEGLTETPAPPPPPVAKPEAPPVTKSKPPPAVKTEPPPVVTSPPPVVPPRAIKTEPPAAAKAEPPPAAKPGAPPVKTEPPPGAKAESAPAAKPEAPPVKTEPAPAATSPPPIVPAPAPAVKTEPPPGAKAESAPAAKPEAPPTTKTEPPPVKSEASPAAVTPPGTPPGAVPPANVPTSAMPPQPPPSSPPAQVAPPASQVLAPKPAEGSPGGGSITGTFTGHFELVEEVIVLGPDSLLKQFARLKVSASHGGATFTIDHVPPGRYVVTPMGARGASLSSRPAAARLVVTADAGGRADFEILGAL